MVIKQIPKAISKRISDISSSKEIYNQNINYYTDALKCSGYKSISLPHNPAQQRGPDKIEKEKRKRKVIWFNPPFSMNVKTNVGKTFLKLLQRHFPKPHLMSNLFNRNTVKISYFCMRSMESVISSHNKQILNPSREYFRYNRRVRNECHLDNKYLTPNIVHEAKVSNKANNECKRYLGASETPFRERFKNHTRNFKHKSVLNFKSQSGLKSHRVTPIVEWSVFKRFNSKTVANHCKPYLTKVFYITQSLRDKKLLNKKSELVNKCRHQNKLLLRNVKRNDTIY